MCTRRQRKSEGTIATALNFGPVNLSVELVLERLTSSRELAQVSPPSMVVNV